MHNDWCNIQGFWGNSARTTRVVGAMARSLEDELNEMTDQNTQKHGHQVIKAYKGVLEILSQKTLCVP